MQIWCQFRIKIKKNAAEIAPSNGAILDEFSEETVAPKQIRCNVMHSLVDFQNRFRTFLSLYLFFL